jgi:cystathionine gamma-synthase
LRGVRSLHARMRVHAENTAQIVEFLTQHPGVEHVYYPGLKDSPGHEIACRQQSCFGAMLSFDVAGGEPAVATLLEGLECFSLAESLGGVESLIAHPASMSHAGMDEAARQRAGIGAGLLRVSVGIEDPADLIADLGAALDRVAKSQSEPHRRRHAS